MVDYNKLRKKFPNKDPKKSGNKAAIKAIAREYELKRAALQGKAPVFRKGVVFYAVVIIGLMIVGSLVLSVAGKGGRARNDVNQLNARKSMDALAVALGRYRFHCGDYPSDQEGLAALAAITPQKKGWAGPYVKKIVDDPWGHPYVYGVRRDGGHPILFSNGPDGKMGTTDDVMPDQSLFERPFEDTSWTNRWMPYQLRGIVVAPNEQAKKAIQEEVRRLQGEAK